MGMGAWPSLFALTSAGWSVFSDGHTSHLQERSSLPIAGRLAQLLHTLTISSV